MSNCCKLRQFSEDGSIVTMTCHEVRISQNDMKASFRKKNRTHKIDYALINLIKIRIQFSVLLNDYLIEQFRRDHC
jgi:hypothetical protein